MNVDELIELYDGIIEDVSQSLLESQISEILPIPAAPTGIEDIVEYGQNHDPLIPEDLTELNSVTIGKLFSFISNWANYVQSELTRAKCIHLTIKRNCKVVESALNIYYKEEKEVPANQVHDRVATDKRYAEIDGAVLRAEVFVKKAETRYEQYKRSLNLISREQTRRGEEFERSSIAESSGERGNRWNRRRK
jgi:hypothetical protein